MRLLATFGLTVLFVAYCLIAPLGFFKALNFWDERRWRLAALCALPMLVPLVGGLVALAIGIYYLLGGIA